MSGESRCMPTAVEVPPELRGQPGIARDEYSERFFASEYPLQSWISANEGIRRFLHSVSMPYVNELFPHYRSELLGKMDAIGTRRPARPPERVTQQDLTDELRAYALEMLGFTMVGFRPYRSKYTFREEVDNVHVQRNVVAVGLEQPYEPTQEIPGRTAEIATVETYVGLVTRSIELAEHLLDRGYRAQPTIKTMLVQPYFVDAGLGQMGANGQMLSPHCGSRARLMLVLTDAPLEHDEPVDHGIPALCRACQVCVRRCPGRALTAEEVWWRGVLKFKTVDRRCVPMLAKYDNCGICMLVCPVQKYGYAAVMEHFKETGEVLGKGSDDLEGYTLPDRGYFGHGALPTFSHQELKIPELPSGASETDR